MNAINANKRPLLEAPQARLGLLLLAICWPLNWTLPGMRTAYLLFPLGPAAAGRSPARAYPGSESGPVSRRHRDGRADSSLAKILLSVRLDIAAADPGTTELLVWAVPFSAGAAGRRLAANHISVRWGAYLRVLLGNVELLFAAKVGLSHARRSIP